MKTIIQQFSRLCLVMVMANAIVLAQTSARSSSSKARTEAEELRTQELRNFREHVLARTLDSIKKMNEPGLRISARNQVLLFLSTTKVSRDMNQQLANQLALDALADLRDHGHELLPFMATYLSNDLRGWFDRYKPDLKDDFENAVKPLLKNDAAQHISSLLELDGGDTIAAQQIRRVLDEHGPLNGLQFWLDELMRTRSKEFQPLASEIVARATQGQISFETLFWISDIYLRREIPISLRNKFLATVVARTDPANFVTEPAPEIVCQLLTNILPFVEQAAPDLYEQALRNNLTIRASLSQRQLASDARNKRIQASLNPIEELMSEARTAKSVLERNELFLQAAQLALEKRRLELCLNVISEIDISEKGADVTDWQRSIDRILKSVVKSAIASKQPQLAEKAAVRIQSILSNVDALCLLIRYWANANDTQTAQRLLSDASKAADTASNNREKSKALFLLSVTCDYVDETRKAELLLSGIKALNNVAKPDNEADKQDLKYQSYVRDLDNVGYELTKGFKSLTRQDQNSALTLVERLQLPDLRTLSLIGILQAADELLSEPPRAQNAPPP